MMSRQFQFSHFICLLPFTLSSYAPPSSQPVCKTVFEEQCYDVPSMVCTDVDKPVTSTVYNEECTTTEYDECRTEQKPEVCTTVYAEHCDWVDIRFRWRRRN